MYLPCCLLRLCDDSDSSWWISVGIYFTSRRRLNANVSLRLPLVILNQTSTFKITSKDYGIAHRFYEKAIADLQREKGNAETHRLHAIFASNSSACIFCLE